jgi:predicted lysophospholipase L1 biosynthesis ABC-type transport system permease subunit
MVYFAVAMIVVFLFMTLVIRQSRREIGILRALGFSKGKVRMLFCGVELVTSCAAVAIGIGLGLVLTHADAVAAVDTELCPNLGAPVTDPNGLGGALPQAGGTAYALVRIQRNRMLIYCHWDNLPVRVISVLPL